MSYARKHRAIIDDYEIVHQCGSGTYGFVFKAIHRQSKTVVALKKVTKFPTEEGSPVEIKYLTKLTNARNIIRLRDHFYTKEGELALVFEYMETDLWRLISGPSPCLPLPQVKCIMKQLLEGLHQCHTAGIMHRDIKPSNLLINSSGVLKLADFGLTTSYISPTYLSNNVVSLYYRSPELLMGSHNYGPEIDVWSAGCILVELLTNNYLFAGANEADQLDLIFRMFGTPSEDIWPDIASLPGWGALDAAEKHPIRPLRENYGFLDPNVIDLASRLLILNPKARMSCNEALQHPWFWTTPLPCHPNYLPQLWRRSADHPSPTVWRVSSSSVERRERGSRGSCNSDTGSNAGNIFNSNSGMNINSNSNNNNNNISVKMTPNSTPSKWGVNSTPSAKLPYIASPPSSASSSANANNSKSGVNEGGVGATVAITSNSGGRGMRAWTAHSRAASREELMVSKQPQLPQPLPTNS